MGTCCSQRDKVPPQSTASLRESKLNTTDITRSLEYVKKYFSEHKDAQMIALSYSKDQLTAWLRSLP